MGRARPPDPRLLTLRAYATHAFTATGAVFAMLAMLAAVDARWSAMFLWLVLAFIVDGVDGTMARRYEVTERAPIIDGVLLDLVIDFLTYVFIPAFALLRSGVLDGPSGLIATLVIVFGSALYFADTRMKTPDKSFSGFPACWNMFALVVFAVRPEPRTVLVLVGLLTVAMFVPVRFVHPMRTRRWRGVSLPVAVVWTVVAGWAAWSDFALPDWAAVTLLVASAYLAVVGAVQQVLERRDALLSVPHRSGGTPRR
jgi:phosphatidylcholine synthase